jgi:predicted MPP superfamily phosphohydrolase
MRHRPHLVVVRRQHDPRGGRTRETSRRRSRLTAAVDWATRALAPRRPVAEVTESECRIVDLADVFDGYTVVALGDFHHRQPWTDVRWLRHAVDASNDRGPDIVVLLGDYGSSFKRVRSLSRRWYRAGLAAMTPELVRLRAADGIFAVLGNHDYYAGADLVRGWLSDIGAEVLVNESRHIVRAGQMLRLAGIDDVGEGSPDPWVGCDSSESSPTIALSHNPDAIERLDRRLRVDAMLAGHTHGGQIVLPWLGAPLTMSRVCKRTAAHGWIPNRRAPLYVTRGLGEQLPLPIRLGCRAEILVLRLRARG